MLFSSAAFLFLFLPSFLLLYYFLTSLINALGVTTTRWHNLLLFTASLVFYAWGEGIIVCILLLSAAINFVSGQLIERGYRRYGLYLSLAGSLSLLVYYKYTNFFFNSIGISMAAVALPIGISFYTFQGISYTLDIYWGRIRANSNFLDFGTYLAMFPHQIAGPIVRYADIAPELSSRKVTLITFGLGAERFIIGLSKKMLLANTFARVADLIFNEQTAHITPVVAWIGAVAYMFQIYYDFSGYSDMAIGLGRMVGFDFKENFNYPYVARSMQDFWRRWHISLSGWFRDYLYVPLGGNRHGKVATYRNLLIVFFVTGLWHGAGWNFILWGLYNGLFLLAERAGWGKQLEKIPSWLAHFYTLLVILIGWVLFREPDLSHTGDFIQKMAGFGPKLMPTAYEVSYFLNPEIGLTFALGILFCGPIYLKIRAFCAVERPLLAILNTLVLAVLLLLSVMYMAAGTYNPFIYFRF